MDITELQQNWNTWGETDALWAILSEDHGKGNRWRVDEFFKTGELEVDKVIDAIASHHVPLQRRRALDFGCGVGRLTQALARHFDEVCGVDIAPSMIQTARKYNRFGDRCRYVVNGSGDLGQFPDESFDFIYSAITLQHVAPHYVRNYLAEFMRVLGHGGVLVFQLPSTPLSLPRLLLLLLARRAKGGEIAIARFPSLYQRYRRLRHKPVMEMHGIPKDQVLGLLGKHGGTAVEVKPDQRAGLAWRSYRYVITKS